MVSYGPIRRKYENTSERKIAVYEDIDDDIAKDINGAMEIIRETVDKMVKYGRTQWQMIVQT